MADLINSIRGVGTHNCDRTAPNQLVDRGSAFGQLRHDTRTVDPLVLQFGAVEPAARIEMLNLSAKPNADWSCDKKTISAPVNVNLPNGTVSIALSDKKAAELDIRPGDRLLFRQVDGAGNASVPVLMKLNARAEPSAVFMISGDRFEQRDTNLDENVQYAVSRYSDNREPVVLPNLMLWENGSGSKDRALTGEKALEPGATIRLQNGRTREVFETVVADNSVFRLPFAAECGDPVSITVTDAHGQSTDLGMMNYLPGDPECVVPSSPVTP